MSLCPLAPLPVPGRVPGMVIGTRGAKGPVRILYIFSSRQMGGILATLYQARQPLRLHWRWTAGSPWELLLVSLQWKETHWKQKQPPACRIHVQLFESTCKRKSILHNFFIQQHSKRNHQSKLLTKACIFAATTSESHHRDACSQLIMSCVYIIKPIIKAPMKLIINKRRFINKSPPAS